MFIKGITDEDFVNYKKPSMLIVTNKCSFKCDKESGKAICQNSSLARKQSINISIDNIINRYLKNDITKAIVLSGLEPFDQFNELLSFITKLRCDYHCDDTVVIYTGYNKSEISSQVEFLKKFKNIIIKFGRFIPDDKSRYDDILGVNLASQNQYAEKIS